MGNTAIIHSAPAAAPGDPPLGYMRLGAYQSSEANLIEKTVPAGDGIYLMTGAQITTNTDGGAYLEAGNGMTVLGNATIGVSDAGQTSIRAMTASIGGGSTPSTSNNDINLQSESDLTLEAETGIEITCERLVYVVNQNLTWSTSAKGVSYYLTQTTFTLGGKTGLYLTNNTDISGLRWEPRIYDHKYALIDNSSVIVKASGQAYKNENHGLKAFGIGLFLPISAAESEATGVKNSNSAAKIEANGIDSQQSGADSENSGIDVESAPLNNN
ncbi:hypothetical protein [Amorphus orientalis]|uniref:Uncharacterized protein n=1 Tax=Amorphus orientalis TaxID=649198 RepID=A0AAE3VLS4_9HYPH|nr:hypothetical protein [Amorphus orientalis]MDQ0314283.1 hypothetical protein [Amorphus orientalis]